jgi:PAS domain S-box-containing protein
LFQFWGYQFLKLSRIVEQGPAAVVITNRKGDIEYVNQKFCSLSGYSKEEVKGKNPRILNSGYHDKKFYEKLWNTILSGNNWNGEILNKKKNGELFWESALISPLLNNEGDIINFVAIKEDITERKRSEKEISMLAQSLKSINELLV